MPVSEIQSTTKTTVVAVAEEETRQLVTDIHVEVKGDTKHSQNRHVRHITHGGWDRASELIAAQIPEDAGE